MPFRLTPRRRQSIIKAQRISARKRKVRGSDTVGYWVAKGVRRGTSKATMGASSMIANFLDENKEYNQRAKRKRRKR